MSRSTAGRMAPEAVGESPSPTDFGASSPELVVVFGARALTAVGAMFAAHLFDAWSRGESSLLPVRVPRV